MTLQKILGIGLLGLVAACGSETLTLSGTVVRNIGVNIIPYRRNTAEFSVVLDPSDKLDQEYHSYDNDLNCVKLQLYQIDGVSSQILEAGDSITFELFDGFRQTATDKNGNPIYWVNGIKFPRGVNYVFHEQTKKSITVDGYLRGYSKEGHVNLNVNYDNGY